MFVQPEALLDRLVDGKRSERQENGVVHSKRRSVDDELLLERHSGPLFVLLDMEQNEACYEP